MNVILKTLVDTAATTAIIAPEVYNTSEPALKEMINTHDFTAPIIALASSLIIQMFIKAFKFLVKKYTKTDLDADITAS